MGPARDRRSRQEMRVALDLAATERARRAYAALIERSPLAPLKWSDFARRVIAEGIEAVLASEGIVLDDDPTQGTEQHAEEPASAQFADEPLFDERGRLLFDTAPTTTPPSRPWSARLLVSLPWQVAGLGVRRDLEARRQAPHGTGGRGRGGG